jgi:hypothetical protein
MRRDVKRRNEYNFTETREHTAACSPVYVVWMWIGWGGEVSVERYGVGYCFQLRPRRDHGSWTGGKGRVTCCG